MGTRSSELIADVYVGTRFTPLIIAAMNRFCSGLTFLVVTEAFVLVVFFSCYAVYLPHILYLGFLVYVVKYRI